MDEHRELAQKADGRRTKEQNECPHGSDMGASKTSRHIVHRSDSSSARSPLIAFGKSVGSETASASWMLAMIIVVDVDDLY